VARRVREASSAVEDIDEGEDDKLWQLAYLLDERPKGAKTLVFTTYKDTAEYLAEAFREHLDPGMEGRRWEVLHGGIKPETRTNVVERFAPRASRRPAHISAAS
jgi:superfamily II DNA/RNA helicase